MNTKNIFEHNMNIAPAGNNIPAKINGLLGSMRLAVEIVLLLTVVALYYLVSVKQLTVCGVTNAEAWAGMPALRIHQGLETPLMISYLEGASFCYLLAPFMSLSDRAFGLRAGCVVYSAIALIFFYLSFRMVTKSSLWALMYILILGFHPSYLLFSRFGAISTGILNLPLSLSLFLLLKWHYTQNKSFLITASAVLGFGVGSGIHFLWFVNGLIITWIIMRLYREHAFKAGDLFIYAASFCVGAFAIIYHNLTNRFEMITHLYGKMVIEKDNYFHASFLKGGIVKAYMACFESIKSLLNGDLFLTITMGVNAAPHDQDAFMAVSKDLLWYLFLVAMLLGIIILASRRTIAKGQKGIVFLLCLICLMILQAPISPHYYPNWQWSLFLPLILFVIVYAFFAVLKSLKYVFALRILAAAILMTVLAGNIIKIHTYYEQERTTGGAGQFSDAFYALVSWLKENASFKPVCASPELCMKSNLEFYSHGAVKTLDCRMLSAFLEGNEGVTGPHLKARIAEEMNNGRYVYIFSPGYDKKYFEKTRTLLQKRNQGLRVIKEFYSKDNKLIYAVYR